MEKNTMNYNYFNHWVPSGKKRGKGELSLNEVMKRFKDKKLIGNTFYIVIEENNQPLYLINYVGRNLFTISKFNDNLDVFLKLDYEIMNNINPDKLFLTRISLDVFDEKYNQVQNTITAFALPFQDKNFDYVWKILDKPIYEKTNFINNTLEKGENIEFLNDNLFRDYPKFGNWDWMIEDIKIMEEILDV